ncbi:hypothetical protein ABZU32_40645 [Sphaerisporangium sp. NPDC005288]|uniref:hypothetical protein n=1 Tax=Sphaerisporangium sp. NPDC005288 TaxID=3155114 RepID=UPI0033BC5B2C
MVLSLNRGFDVMAKGGMDGADLDAAAEQAFQGLPLTSRYRDGPAPAKRRTFPPPPARRPDPRAGEAPRPGQGAAQGVSLG